MKFEPEEGVIIPLLRFGKIGLIDKDKGDYDLTWKGSGKI